MLADVGWDDPRAVALRGAQQAEIAALYGGRPDPGWDMDGTSVVAFVLVDDADGTPLGCGGLRRDDELDAELGVRTGELKRMYVVPDARGRGLARELLTALEDRARALGLARLVLETGPAQVAAQRLYTSAGYRRTSAWGAYADDADSLAFVKELV